jgi:hypothetical protein
MFESLLYALAIFCIFGELAMVTVGGGGHHVEDKFILTINMQNSQTLKVTIY